MQQYTSKFLHDMSTVAILVLCLFCFNCVVSYDPDDKIIDTILPSKDLKFESFYPRKAYGLPNGDSRPPHGHNSFYKHRHPALIDTPNPSAYGFRFDGVRRFNFD